jgi:hypothetical protein
LTKFGAAGAFRPCKLLPNPFFRLLYDLIKNMKKLKFDILTKFGAQSPFRP